MVVNSKRFLLIIPFLIFFLYMLVAHLISKETHAGKQEVKVRECLAYRAYQEFA